MDFAKLLKQNKLSVTVNRVAILECLSDKHDHFHSISDISKHIGDINTKSIYNNIKQLIQVGLVDSYSFGGISKYALNENVVAKTNEIHIVGNAKTIDHMEISAKIFNDIEKQVAKKGMTVAGIKIFVKVK